ncbi:sterol desaturase family protein [Leptolyngbya sp. Heron Island J]|uniref:sterol desaturase family protein n=1 Tax=Leptolyngbya sp. Heron Island J TaxID=1385935 RepID=UPI001F3060DC|nr:sterol desaturase family protein [Leptolyngbya sp. Heron Island J]
MLLAMRLWEIIAPCRRLSAPRLMRWFSNIGLLILGTIILRAIFPIAAVGVAMFAEKQQWGLFYTLSIPYWQSIVLTIIGLDFTTYWQHVIFHSFPVLWQLHKVHHADLDFDVTTGFRFHPLEILLSMVGKILTILLLGTPVTAVLIFEVLLNATSMFNHGNVQLPSKLESLLRWIVVTPDMHRIHHSTITQETDSNFGFNLPWWDYLFGTYRPWPSVSHQKMAIGLTEYQKDLRVAQLQWMLVLPFLKQPSNHNA